MKKFQILLFAAAMIFAACRKDNLKTDFDFVPTGGDEQIDNRLIGQVINAAGLPINEAIVSINGESTSTDEQGVFNFQNIKIEKNGSLVTIEKNGFFKNYKRVIPTKNSTFVKFGLTEMGMPQGSFVASAGGTIKRPGKEQLIFQPNSIVDESGNDYTGEVTVFTDFFNRDKQNLAELMPGDLSGIDTEGTRVQLETYSMIMVELYGEAGQSLNLKPGTTAAAEFPISQNQIANAPEEIILWSLDEDTGLWIEEGKAVKNGAVYQAELPHFSFWNCDAPYPLSNITGTLLDQNGYPIANHLVWISIDGGGETGSGYTNIDGIFIGKVPRDQQLILTIFNNCGDVIHTENFTVNSDDFTLPDIIVDLSTNAMLLTGTVTNCAGDPVQSGYVSVIIDSGQTEAIQVDSDGNFSQYINVCDNSDLQVLGIDFTTFATSLATTVVNTGQSSEDIGDLIACDSLDEYFSVTKNGTQILFYDNASTSLDEDVLTLGKKSFNIRVEPPFPNPNNIVGFASMTFENPVMGDNTPSFITIIPENSPRLRCDEDQGTELCLGNFTVNFTQYDTFTNGYVEGISTGNLWENNVLVPITIEFRVKVDVVLSNYSGTIWEDLNKNGIRESNEPGVEKIQLFYDHTTLDGENWQSDATTDSNGNYEIAIAEANSGVLATISLPSGYIMTLQNQGTDESIDSDFSPITEELVFPIQDLAVSNLIDMGIHLQ